MSQFRSLLFHRGDPRFYAFDLLYCDGEDLRFLPLQDRKQRLRAVISVPSDSLLYCDHVDLAGEEFFHLACKCDLEGIVAKRRYDPYLPESAAWLKIRNGNYSQWAGREELFEREPGNDPEMSGWALCAAASELLIQEYGAAQ